MTDMMLFSLLRDTIVTAERPTSAALEENEVLEAYIYEHTVMNNVC